MADRQTEPKQDTAGHLDPLEALRAIRDDRGLTAHQKMLLTAAVLRADNDTAKVGASLTLLAEDAGLSREYVTRQMQDAPEVLAYCAKVKRKARRTDVWLQTAFESVERDGRRVTVVCASSAEVVSAHVTEDHMHVTGDHMASDSGSHHLPSSTPTSTNTPPRAPATPQQQPAAKSSGLAQQLADATGWPLTHCRQTLNAEHTRLAAKLNGGHRAASSVLRRTVTEEPHTLPAPITRTKPVIPGDCDGTNCPGTKHVVETEQHQVVCWGVHAA